MAKGKSYKPTRRETQQTIAIIIRKLQHLEETQNGGLHMLQHYIEMKGDTEEYKKYLDDVLGSEDKEPSKEENTESK
tara:strand:- start:715 stop:945 length:231 start_codon:yes stop_codon:yes gene_type:complete